jgi:hypothetical protein
MTAASVDQLCDALGLDGFERTCVCALDPCDFDILAAARTSQANNCHALAAATGLGLDQLNQSLSKLMRLGVVRMDGDQWHIIEREIA